MTRKIHHHLVFRELSRLDLLVVSNNLLFARNWDHLDHGSRRHLVIHEGDLCHLCRLYHLCRLCHIRHLLTQNHLLDAAKSYLHCR